MVLCKCARAEVSMRLLVRCYRCLSDCLMSVCVLVLVLGGGFCCGNHGRMHSDRSHAFCGAPRRPGSATPWAPKVNTIETHHADLDVGATVRAMPYYSCSTLYFTHHATSLCAARTVSLQRILPRFMMTGSTLLFCWLYVRFVCSGAGAGARSRQL